MGNTFSFIKISNFYWLGFQFLPLIRDIPLRMRGAFFELSISMYIAHAIPLVLHCQMIPDVARGFQLRRNHARVSSPRFSLPLPYAPHSEPILLQVSPLRCEKVGESGGKWGPAVRYINF